ncbi:MAG: hypothetical protein AAGL49_11855 [Pseudomonadota bacterium]
MNRAIAAFDPYAWLRENRCDHAIPAIRATADRDAWESSYILLMGMDRPKHISDDAMWTRIKRSAGVFMDRFVTQARRYGWKPIEVFGVDVDRSWPFTTLALLPNRSESEIMSISQDSLSIQHPEDGEKTLYRHWERGCYLPWWSEASKALDRGR